MWLSMIWFILVLFVCWNLICTIANLKIKCVTETRNVSVLFYKNIKSSFSTWLTHLTLRFLYFLGCSGPRCASTTKECTLHSAQYIDSVQKMISQRSGKFKSILSNLNIFQKTNEILFNFELSCWGQNLESLQRLDKLFLKFPDLYKPCKGRGTSKTLELSESFGYQFSKFWLYSFDFSNYRMLVIV
jgi:hypothetical protein